MTKAWWLGFPRFHCPHCGGLIEGLKFTGHFKLPRAKRLKELHSPGDVEREGRDP